MDIKEGVYWVQVQALAGNWVDRIGFPGTDEGLERAKSSADYERRTGSTARVVAKTITIIEGF